MGLKGGNAMGKGGAKRLRTGVRGIWDRVRNAPEQIGSAISDTLINQHRKPKGRGKKTVTPK